MNENPYQVAVWAAGGRAIVVATADTFEGAVKAARTYVAAPAGSLSAWINGEGRQWSVNQAGMLTEIIRKQVTA